MIAGSATAAYGGEVRRSRIAATACAAIIAAMAALPSFVYVGHQHWTDADRIIDGLALRGEESCAASVNTRTTCDLLEGLARAEVTQRNPGRAVDSMSLAIRPTEMTTAEGRRLVTHGIPYSVQHTIVVIVTLDDGQRVTVAMRCIGGDPNVESAWPAPAECTVDESAKDPYRATELEPDD
jgi:hypothetical protein